MMAMTKSSRKRASPDIETDYRSMKTPPKFSHSENKIFDTLDEQRLWNLEDGNIRTYSIALKQYNEAKKLGPVPRYIYYTTGSLSETYATLAGMRIATRHYECTTNKECYEVFTMPSVYFEPVDAVVRRSVLTVLGQKQ